jgi:hypothetical protein
LDFALVGTLIGNLAFSHLCHFVLKDPSHLTSFNQALASKLPKEKAIQQSTNSLDLRNFTYWRFATLLSLQTKTSTRYWTGKLDTRNMAAHLSTVKFTQVDVEHYILDAD